jgi:hypothetical protein
VSGDQAAAAAELELEAAPEPFARERVAMFETPAGDWVIARAAPICETCAACGCGEQQAPITLPSMLVGILKAQAEGRKVGIGQLRKLAAMGMGHLAAANGEADPGD